MPEDPAEDKELEVVPPEILGMRRIERPKSPIGEIDAQERERFKAAATNWMEHDKLYRMSGVVYTHRLIPEKLLVIDYKDYDGMNDPSLALQGKIVMRSYYPRGASSDLDVTARAILEKKTSDSVYQVTTIFKDIEGKRDHRNVQIGSDYLNFQILSPELTTGIMYGENGELQLFEFEVDSGGNQDEDGFVEPPENEEVTIFDIEYSGGYDYTTVYGDKIHFSLDKDGKYITMVSTKGDRTRIRRVPVQLEKIIGIVEIGPNNPIGQIKFPRR